MTELTLLAVLVWALTIAVFVLAVVACWRRREVGLYLLTLNLAISALERLAPMLGFHGLYQTGTLSPMLMGVGHLLISFVAWAFLALKGSERKKA